MSLSGYNLILVGGDGFPNYRVSFDKDRFRLLYDEG
jgi:hypothetical protein